MVFIKFVSQYLMRVSWHGEEATGSRDEDIMNTLASLVGLGNKHKMSLSGTTFVEVNLISYWFTGTSLLSHVNHATPKEFFP